MNIPAYWTFNSEEVARGFDRHVREQLPWYDLATGIVTHVARHYVPEGGLVYDVGASTGNIGRALEEVIEKRSARFVAIDSAREMADIYSGPGAFVTADATTYAFERFDFAVVFLALMFFPVDCRRSWIESMAAKTKPGGALLVFDKCAPGQGYVSTVMSRLALSGKRSAGVPADEIIEKELSLAGVQRPIDAEKIMPDSAVEVFRFGDFAGWIIEGPTEEQKP